MRTMAKVFLSHATVDAALANAVHGDLTARHHDVFLDHARGDGIAPGADWERTLYERLQWADALVCIVTRRYVESHWCFAEIALAKAYGRMILPLTAEVGVAHPLLGAVQSVAYATEPAQALDRLAEELAGLEAGGGVARDPTRPVYPGLAAFDGEDRAMFFGRSDEIHELARQIRSRVVSRQPRADIVIGA